MRVKQVDRSLNSVTINVSGITEGNRQTYIWMPSTVLNSTSGKWFTLGEASTNGYITKIETDYEDNNGDITVYLPAKYYNKHKVVQLEVHNVDTSSGDSYIFLNAVLDFEYQNTKTKVAGTDVDITIPDMQGLNAFGQYIDLWTNSGEHNGKHYPLDDIPPNDKIYAVYLQQPAINILDAAFANRDYLGANYDKIWGYLSTMTTKCVSGADFKATWFNQIADAIRSFNISYTI